MALDIKRVEYYNIIVGVHAGEASMLLSMFADAGVSLLAFKETSIDSSHTQFSLFPNDSSKMINGAKRAGLQLGGPHAALLIQGDDEAGSLGEIYEKLSQAGIQVNEASGIADIKGAYGVVLYLKQEDCEKAMAALAV